MAGPQQRKQNEMVISYMFLRKTVGWIGTLLPVVLITGNVALFTRTLPGSMSGYYYTHLRDLFVGALCALGVFLLSYVGYDEVDRWVTNIAGLGAIGVAFFPTKPPVCAAGARTCAAPWVRHLSDAQQVTGDLHLFFAAVTFIALGLMALRFTKSAGPRGRTPRKKQRNMVYRACGVSIWLCVVLAAASNLLPAAVKSSWPWLFVFEALAVFAFGISWFVKGETLQTLKDRPEPGRAPSQDLEPVG